MIAYSYYHHIWPANQYLPKAIAFRESREDPFAVGDDGLAVGLFQLHWDFIVTWAGNSSGQAFKLPGEQIVAHWSPGIWALAVGNFLTHHHDEQWTVQLALNLFHYGHVEAADPDHYVAAVELAAAVGKLTW